jgi:hypothetical protein
MLVAAGFLPGGKDAVHLRHSGNRRKAQGVADHAARQIRERRRDPARSGGPGGGDRHGRPGPRRPGPLEVEAAADDAGLTVVVRDEGVGIRPQADTERDSLRLGLSLIAALSSSFAIAGGIDRGTEITMRVPLRGGGADGKGDSATLRPRRAERTELVIDRSELLGPVLGRVVGALAARRDLSVDRVSDAVLVTDAIAATAPRQFSDGRVRLGFDEREQGIDLRLGPMEAGAAAKIRGELDVPDVGGSLEKLADGLTVEESADGEYLVIRFAAAP